MWTFFYVWICYETAELKKNNTQSIHSQFVIMNMNLIGLNENSVVLMMSLMQSCKSQH